jgi:hypothetical protein
VEFRLFCQDSLKHQAAGILSIGGRFTLIWGFIDGFIGGAFLAWLYNKFTKELAVCLQNILGKSSIKIREGFRFQISFSGRLSNL